MQTAIENHTNEFVLPFSPDYVPHWGFWEACRELIQNAVDQSEANWQSEVVFEYDSTERTMRIGCTQCELLTKTLLLGESSKRGNSSSRGKHGEGYKLALLVLCRQMRNVKVRNNHQIWTPKFAHSEQWGDTVLTITVEQGEDWTDGVVFEFDDVSHDDFAEVAANWIPDEKLDTILFQEYLVGRVFVGGLFVCEVPKLQHGYNFAPSTMSLDRDRSIAGAFEVSTQGARFWAKAPTEKLLNMLEGKVLDVQYVIDHLSKDRRQEIADLWKERNPGAVPVQSGDNLDFFEGQSTKVVPAVLGNVIRDKFEVRRTIPKAKPFEILTKFKSDHHWALCADAEHEFDVIIEASKGWRA